MDYEFWLSAEASRNLLGSDRRVRTKMTDGLQQLASKPFGDPDFREQSPSGRTYEVRVFDDIIVTYWVDHAVKEVRIVRLEVA